MELYFDIFQEIDKLCRSSAQYGALKPEQHKIGELQNSHYCNIDICLLYKQVTSLYNPIYLALTLSFVHRCELNALYVHVDILSKLESS